MKRWRLHYELTNHFGVPVTHHFYTLRCFPMELISQKVLSCKYEVVPGDGAARGRDAFGNAVLTGRCEESHEWFLVQMEAMVMTKDGVEPDYRAACQLGMYRHPSGYTKMGKTLQEFAKCHSIENAADEWEWTGQMMKAVWEHFLYQSGSTGIHTTAEEAFAQGMGVCQDYAHSLLALCRDRGITARYVAGTIPGEGQTHAWIEVWKDGFWKGFDPTNNCEANEDYIRFAVGRDAGDCALNRGIFYGSGVQNQQVHVRMEES